MKSKIIVEFSESAKVTNRIFDLQSAENSMVQLISEPLSCWYLATLCYGWLYIDLIQDNSSIADYTTVKNGLVICYPV